MRYKKYVLISVIACVMISAFIAKLISYIEYEKAYNVSNKQSYDLWLFLSSYKDYILLTDEQMVVNNKMHFYDMDADCIDSIDVEFVSFIRKSSQWAASKDNIISVVNSKHIRYCRWFHDGTYYHAVWAPSFDNDYDYNKKDLIKEYNDNQFLTFQYDPTNGFKSNGDIICLRAIGHVVK